MISVPEDPSRDAYDRAVEALLPTASIESARTAVAREAGFSGWPALQRYLDVVEVHRRDNDPHVATETIPDEFCRLACLTYTDDPPERRAAARELLGVHPDLTRDHIWAAAAAADTGALRALLAMDPDLAKRDGGPYGWKPLLYLTYSRVGSGASFEQDLLAARLLLRAGADPNAGYLWRGRPTPFTALTGVFGEGAQGPGQCPRHPHADALARMLLTAGAEANDAQTLYNRAFGSDDTHLQLLFQHGLGRGDGGAWRALLGEALESPAQMLHAQLGWAVRHGFADRVELLIGRGVDVSGPLRDGRTAADIAAANGDRRILGLLTAAGAVRPEPVGLDAYVAVLLAGDADAAESGRDTWLGKALVARPALVAEAVVAGRIDAIPLLTRLGFDVDALADGQAGLHHAAWAGDVATVRALLDAGADPLVPDDAFGATPLDWAQQAGRDEVAAFLERLASVSSA